MSRRKTRKEEVLQSVGLLPEISHQLDELFYWLSREKLIFDGSSYDVSKEEFAAQFCYEPQQFALAQSTHRSKTIRHTQKELKELKDKHQGEGLGREKA